LHCKLRIMNMNKDKSFIRNKKYYLALLLAGGMGLVGALNAEKKAEALPEGDETITVIKEIEDTETFERRLALSEDSASPKALKNSQFGIDTANTAREEGLEFAQQVAAEARQGTRDELVRANIIKLIAKLESSQIANGVSVRGVQLFLDEISEGVRDEIVRADVLAESQQVAADAQDTAGVEVVPTDTNLVNIQSVQIQVQIPVP